MRDILLDDSNEWLREFADDFDGLQEGVFVVGVFDDFDTRHHACDNKEKEAGEMRNERTRCEDQRADSEWISILRICWSFKLSRVCQTLIIAASHTFACIDTVSNHHVGRLVKFREQLNLKRKRGDQKRATDEVF